MMKTILLIGLGRFGKNVALHLNQLGHQVMAVDDVEQRVEAVLPYVTNAQIGNSTIDTDSACGNHFFGLTPGTDAPGCQYFLQSLQQGHLPPK